MDVLKPSTYWVGNRCYRVLTHQVENSHYNYAEEDAYSDENVYNDEAECGAEGTHEYEVEQTSNGKYKTSWHIPSPYYPHIIGAKGATRKRLEQESGCQIIIPPRGATGDVVVIGFSIGKVRTGRLKVELLVEQSRRKLPPTHFVSVPLNFAHLQDNFLKFKARVLGVCGLSRGVTEELFQEPGRLHLTLGVMTSLDDKERATAVQALTQAVQDSASLLHGGCFRLRVCGLHYFNDDPSEVAVLYAGLKHERNDSASNKRSETGENNTSQEKGGASPNGGGTSPDMGGASQDEGGASIDVDRTPATEDQSEGKNFNYEEDSKDASPELFQNFTDYLVHAMVEAGVMQQQHSAKVKLHMTLLNTSFLLRDREDDQAEPPQPQGPTIRKPKETFDARDILQNFNQYDFGVVEVREVQLSVMHTRDPQTGYYTASTVLTLPVL